jgi:cytochrome P450
MMKWRMKKLMEQILEWVKYYMELKVDLVCFWVGPIPIVAAFSAESVKVCFRSSFLSKLFQAILDSNVVITKGDEYNILKRWLGDGLLISKGEKWRKRRKLLTPSFHFNILQRFQSVFDKEAQVKSVLWDYCIIF